MRMRLIRAGPRFPWWRRWSWTFLRYKLVTLFRRRRRMMIRRIEL